MLLSEQVKQRVEGVTQAPGPPQFIVSVDVCRLGEDNPRLEAEKSNPGLFLAVRSCRLKSQLPSDANQNKNPGFW